MSKQKDNSEVTIHASHDEFCKTHGLEPPKRIEFDRSRVNPEELEVLKGYFSSLCTELTIYKDLFIEKESVGVMNEFNSFIFPRIQRAYIEKICLSLACLLDPAQTGKNKNLSLDHLVKQCECLELGDKLEQLKNQYISTGIKEWRNKLLAHNDLNTLMGTKPLELTFEHDDIVNIIKSIQEVFDIIVDPTVHADISVVLPYDKSGSAFIRKLKLSMDNDV